MLPQQTVEELLSIANVQAIAAQSGVSIANFDRDFGFDGHFRRITTVGKRRYTCGDGLDFQLKASINCEIEQSHIRYDLESKTYNDLIRRYQNQEPIPCVLLLKVLPTGQENWLNADEDGLFLGGACYWSHLEGDLSSNKESVRIRIPRTQQFTPDALLRLLNATRNYATSGVWTC